MNLSEFTGKYKLSKTLCFELQPIGKTRETIKTAALLKRDETRAREYPDVKKVLDEQHKALLERTLSAIPVETFKWAELEEALLAYRKDKTANKSPLETKRKSFREKLVATFKKDELYKALTEVTPKKFFEARTKQAKEKGEKVDSSVETFSKFACYFQGYQETRKNIYSAEPQATAAAYRAINENFPKFLDAVTIFNTIQENYCSISEDAEKELKGILNGQTLKEVFTLDAYSSYLSQDGIDRLNTIIGGQSLEDKTKIRGINEFINLYRQTHKDAQADKKLAVMPRLYKQILSDRETISFVAEMFINDHDVCNSIQKFMEEKLDTIELNGQKVNVCKHLAATLSKLSELSDDPGIYIDRLAISKISKNLYERWNIIENAMVSYTETNFKAETKRKQWLKKKAYSLAELSEVTKPKSEDAEDSKTLEKITIVKNWERERAKKLFDEICTTQAEAKKVLNNVKSEDLDLRKNKEAVATIKAFLDAVQDLLHFIKPLHVSAELERNLSFYEDFDPLYDTLDSIVPLYNRVRNYMTQKVAEEKKIKLMFDSPSLANGWDLNKEKDNKCILLQRDNFYFLGIVNPKQKVDFGKLETTKKIPCYQKMVYKLLPGPNKMLPKVFIHAKNKRTLFNPAAELLKKYSAEMYKKGDTFDLAFCHELIDFFKDCINKHEDWSKFDFKFSKTSTYTGIDGFYREVADQGYKLTSVNIPVETIDALVEKGSLSLFKIYNKDFAPGAKGMPNMHTLYWKALFATENLKDVVLKLNGEAELFYRPAGNKTQDKIFSHKVGEKMVNRRDTEGNSIAEDVHGELFDYVNGKKKKADLSQEAQRLINEKRIIVKDVTHEIIKDRRFTEEKFLFHVPITLNFKAPDKPAKFNDQVADYLRNNPKVNIIGIDRGERNLLYLTLINQKGEILQQKSFNEVDQLRSDGKTFPVNYHQKLDQAESARDKARKSWDTIGKIKDLKSGYLSQVVHEITTLMIENNAIIVLEDLNFGFKRGRFRIEKQVYQKFEKALIDKLNYLVFKKTNDMNAAGGVLKGYQLTDKFVSFERLGKQTGFLFYIPAAYTSIIDPTTAFSNLFNIGKYTNAKNCKTFFETFKSICYEKKRDAFAFDFDYKDFKQRLIPKRSKWTVYSAEKRLVFDPEMGGEKTTSPTQIIKDALLEQNVTLKDGFDLLAYIKTLESSKATAFFKKLHNAFKITLQMRNSRKETNEDYIQSPVLNSAGAFFDSRTAAATLPQDADANGAYHIALKGLYLLRNAFKKDKPELKITHEAWFEFAQDFAKAKFTN